MAIQIGQKSDPTAGPIVGIDLGTTHSLVAIVRDGKPEVLMSREGRRLLPSIVSFIDGDGRGAAHPVVGYAAKAKKVRDASHTVFSVKRLLGKGFADIEAESGKLPYEITPGEGGVRVRVGDRLYSAVEISAMILHELKLSAEKALGGPVTRAVITVPAYFNDSQRQATRTAGRLAGLDVLRIVNEPTAASLAYGLDRKKEGLIAVYDLGGGTFDVSILKLRDGVFEVLATNGDTTLGGDDLDQALVRVAAQEIGERWGINPMADPGQLAALLEAAETTKISLSEKPLALFEAEIAGKKYSREWTVKEFESLIEPILLRTREPCLKALKDAGLKPGDLSDVVLVGGPTRLSVVQRVAREIFGREPNTSMHPDEVVAAGAAIQADILAGNNRDLLLLDVVPLSLGIEIYGGLMSPLISRNTPIPTVARERFTTFVDNQTAVDIHVLQGERERVADNRSLARFKLRVDPRPAGEARVEVSFLIDADGILQVSAKNLQTGDEQSVEVRPSFGLSDTEIERLLEERAKYAEADVEFRKLAEARNEVEPAIRAAEKRLPDADRLLTPAEAELIRDRLADLRKALRQPDAQKIRQCAFLLDEASRKLADLILKEALARGAE
ncbi:MAG: molecular chaperone DnaK [Oligoflexia bacterium]|nr:molecular chaperone DnaK [Oligoflexia bacterium]